MPEQGNEYTNAKTGDTGDLVVSAWETHGSVSHQLVLLLLTLCHGFFTSD